MAGSRLVNRNITAGGGRTSMRLEPEVWDALREICIREGLELRELIKDVEKNAAPGGRTSAVRVHVLQYFRAAATETGHVQAGHGTRTVTGGPIKLPAETAAEVAEQVAFDGKKDKAGALEAMKVRETSALEASAISQLEG